MNKEFYLKNRENLFKKIKDNSMVILKSGEAPRKSADENYIYTPNRNFYYLTGISEENITLLMYRKNDKNCEIIFVHEPNELMEKWLGKTITKDEAKELSGVEDIRYEGELNEVLHELIFGKDITKMYLDLDKVSFDSTKSCEENLAKSITDKYPQVKIKNIYNIIANMRMVKQKEEIEEIKYAIEITKDGILNVMKNAKPNMYENELEAYFNFTLKTRKVTDFAFTTISAGGKNGTILHYSKNNEIVKDNELVLMDLGAQWNYYNADLTRTFPVNGKFTERQKEIYNIVLNAQLETIKFIKPGLKLQEVKDFAKGVLTNGIKNIGLISEDEEIIKYYYHGVSHHLGLDTHDVGDKDELLCEGMVLTVEPGLYIEEESIGIRIEDDVVVTKDGCEVLSKDMIKTVEEIEDYMKK